MDLHICATCGVDGELSLDESCASGKRLLAECDDGNLACLPCYMERESICIHCSEETDLFPDTSCKAEPWLCEECLNLPYRIHMFTCYSSGCMTEAEFADEAYREILMEEEEKRYGN